mmetsp:Transcript_6654/g.18584  ORF Transcript_6654/g.18584 Transcript_6654/m.18584 type:complete len:162 (+) Transcript_6654:146-631(+)|eukprot:CAMPEP_0181030774 /NCGR_PEP_ID=MMETSP1070-20121207/5895_1 /TAXON_ID=265543 /ORGANISM="Minutocellus polymorphus, Strain NH13" /LENGTH=161 /DNA_ID=CAMNT_0023108141 /DNA_START=82 /DNA_END=567 /DNA_ORIENTATION=-
MSSPPASDGASQAAEAITNKTQTKDVGPSFELPSELPTLPSFTGRSGDPLYDSLSAAVSATNAALAQVEEKTGAASSTVLSRMRSVGNQSGHIFRDGFVLYERRGQYGPQLVAGSALLFGGIVGLRRGRIPGALVGSAAGIGAYVNVYGIDGFAFDGKKVQ